MVEMSSKWQSNLDAHGPYVFLQSESVDMEDRDERVHWGPGIPCDNDRLWSCGQPKYMPEIHQTRHPEPSAASGQCVAFLELRQCQQAIMKTVRGPQYMLHIFT